MVTIFAHGSRITSLVNIPQLASGSDDGAIKIWDLGSFLDEFGDGSATSEEQKEIVRSVVRCHLIVVPS